MKELAVFFSLGQGGPQDLEAAMCKELTMQDLYLR